MKGLFFLLFPALLSAQKVSYRIDPVAKDSFFLVEITETATTKENPRPSTTESSQLFRSKDQIEEFVAYLGKQADDSRAQAKKYSDTANRLGHAEEMIGTVIRINKDFWEDKPIIPIVTPPVKTKPKKAEKQ